MICQHNQTEILDNPRQSLDIRTDIKMGRRAPKSAFGRSVPTIDAKKAAVFRADKLTKKPSLKKSASKITNIVTPDQKDKAFFEKNLTRGIHADVKLKITIPKVEEEDTFILSSDSEDDLIILAAPIVHPAVPTQDTVNKVPFSPTLSLNDPFIGLSVQSTPGTTTLQDMVIEDGGQHETGSISSCTLTAPISENVVEQYDYTSDREEWLEMPLDMDSFSDVEGECNTEDWGNYVVF